MENLYSVSVFMEGMPDQAGTGSFKFQFCEFYVNLLIIKTLQFIALLTYHHSLWIKKTLINRTENENRPMKDRPWIPSGHSKV